MTTLLVVETSPRGSGSISRNMTQSFLQRWKIANPSGEIIERDLVKTDLQFITEHWLEAYFTPADQHTSQMKERLQLSDELIDELQAADQLVIATPVYNYNVPASLKAWIDAIVRKGKTLGFDGHGLVTDKKATVLIASGGVYTEGAFLQDRDIATHYLRLILKVIGITDVTFIAGGGAKAVDLGELTMGSFVEKLSPELVLAAAK
ncbi:FMN-dependent NADH-azoreductase [Advenella incenata]|uniref:FMN dependent NADH:quinone oxidoreductase n=1 Tax=Advenella incenata TaxID=267800 RepID=A0A4Q7VPG7_9BURK|nr:NAD(P)H-dependent oxidoreductase [Advenella incenata]RZT98313.1 FMN-dependent NADH-azoreductase [Advenella incenata]